MTYVGLVLLITVLIVGAGHFYIAKFIVIISIIVLLPGTATIIMTAVYAGSNMTIVEATRLILTLTDLGGGIFFILKGVPVKHN
ncbi:MAG: hypothetical protein ACP6IP_02850 [Candidatus Njordarchaeia archaeon]